MPDTPHVAQLRAAEAEARKRISALETGHPSYNRDRHPFRDHGTKHQEARAKAEHRERMAKLRAPELDRWRRKLARIEAMLRAAGPAPS